MNLYEIINYYAACTSDYVKCQKLHGPKEADHANHRNFKGKMNSLLKQFLTLTC